MSYGWNDVFDYDYEDTPEYMGQKIIEDMLSFSISFLKTFPSPIKCLCPTNSSRFLGRSLEARG